MRILFIGNVWSIHTARWIGQLAGQPWDVHVFPSRDLSINPLFRIVTIHDMSFRPAGLPEDVRTPGARFLRRALRSLARRLHAPPTRFIRPIAPPITSFAALDTYARVQGRRLAALVEKVQPDLVHSLQFQYDSYPALYAKKILGERFPTWIATNWGADIHHFGQFPDHARVIRDILARCDYYSCECCRDVDLARAFGYQGPVLPVIPNTGGYNLPWARQFRQPGPTSGRKEIALKGYKDWVYRGMVGLEALGMCKDILIERGYEVNIYLGGPEMEARARQLGLPFRMIPYSPHEDMLRLHGRSRVSIGLSMSDAISTSFLEAMVMGAFPIQSFTSCANEWAQDGVGAFLVPPEDPLRIADAIARALTDDALVDQADAVNAVTVAERLDEQVVRPQAIAFYQDLKLK